LQAGENCEHCPYDGAHSVKFGAPSKQENLPFSFTLIYRFMAIEPAKMLSYNDESSHG